VIIDPFRFANGWTPANLGSPPYVWPTNTSTITDNGGFCQLWEDSRGNGRNFVQASGTDRPTIDYTGIGGLRTIVGDTNDIMQASGGSARDIFKFASAGYIFFIFERNSSAGGGVSRILLFTGNNSGNQVRFSILCDVAAAPDCLAMNVRRLDADSPTLLTGSTTVNTGPHMGLAIMDWSTGAAEVWVDGTLDGSNGSLTSAGSTSNTSANANLGLFASPALTAYADVGVPEFWAGPYLPTSTEIDQMFGYAAHKYGLTSLLPALHPYKTTPP
jgi:hypothetical protein